MRYITNTLDFQLDKRSVVTLGKFDGLHRGHDKLITRALELGKNGYDTVVFTFDVSPLVKLGTRITRTLLTNEERRVLLERKKIDCLIECPFVPEVIHMEPQDFVITEREHHSFCKSWEFNTDFRWRYWTKRKKTVGRSAVPGFGRL